MPTKLAVKFTHQLANSLPSDIVYKIMDYASYKWRQHPTHKRIKKGIEDKHKVKDFIGDYYPIFREDDWPNWGWRDIRYMIRTAILHGGWRPLIATGYEHNFWRHPVNYIERDCAKIFREVDVCYRHKQRADLWFAILTEQYADINEEWRDNLLHYHNMIMEAGGHIFALGEARLRARCVAWGLYKRLSDCPTMVY